MSHEKFVNSVVQNTVGTPSSPTKSLSNTCLWYYGDSNLVLRRSVKAIASAPKTT